MEKYDYYVDQYKLAHAEVNTIRFPGISIRYYIKDIDQLIKKTNSSTLLDFGCGKGHQYTGETWQQKWGPLPNTVWGITPTLYDPAVKGINTLPEEKFDGVISTDVMEHVPEDAVNFVLNQIISKANKFVFLAIATYLGKPTSYKLPNGESPHITVKPDTWWIKQVQQLNPNIKVKISFNGRVNGKQRITHWTNF